jgi:RND superfamily putative drug exporter
VFQWGWFANFFGVASTGPIFPFVPIMVFAILFGLSMDYQVFLVSRMQEEWNRTGDNLTSIRRGLAGSGRVVVIAALIMSSVFMAFIPSTESIIKLFGVALASAVLIDAFVIRLVLIPSLMTLFGKANWWLPGWLDRILPTLHIEPGEDEVADDEPSRLNV